MFDTHVRERRVSIALALSQRLIQIMLNLNPWSCGQDAMSQKIMLVEDNPTTRKLFRTVLEAAGYTVVEAPDGRSALELARDVRVDLILQDIALPDIDGFELVDLLRGILPNGRLPIIAVTGLLSAIPPEGRAAFTGYLTKPVENARLLQVVKAILAEAAAAENQSSRGDGFVLVIDDDPLQRKLTTFRLDQLGIRVETAVDGDEGLAKARALHPRVIVSDVLMPKVDGFRLSQTIRMDETLADTPVFLVSNLSFDEHDHALARDVGCSGLFSRTANDQELIEKIAAAMHEPRQRFSKIGAAAASNAQIQMIVGQIQRQIDNASGLRAQVGFHQAQLAVLAGFAANLSELPTRAGIRDALILASFDAAGISRGAVFLADERQELAAICSTGFDGRFDVGVGDFFGNLPLLRRAMALGAPVRIPSAEFLSGAEAASLLERMASSEAVLAPLMQGDEVAGLLLVAFGAEKSWDQNWSAHARTMSAHLAHALALGNALFEFAEAKVRMIEASKMASLGEMAGCVAHEINSPLTIILGHVRMLDKLVKEPDQDHDRIRNCTQTIAAASGRIKNLVASLLGFSRDGGNDSFQPMSINALVAEAIDLCRERFKMHNVALHEPSVDQSVLIESRGTGISQVLLNLLGNAFDAVEASSVRWVKVEVAIVHDQVEIRVTDSGPGVPEHLREKIMRPFFTTKPVGRGTGLGLAISQRIIQEHGGSLALDLSGPHTCFAFRIPRLDAGAPESSRSTTAAP